MSGRLVGVVLQDRLEDAPPRARQGLRTVLIVLAEAAREDGGRPLAWPSVATIADRALLSERQVARLLGQLQQLGRIRPVGSRTGGRARTTRWQLLLGHAESEKGDTTSPYEARERVTSEPVKGDTQMSPEPYEPCPPYPPPSGGMKDQGKRRAPAPTLPGLGRGEEGMPALGRGSRAAGTSRRSVERRRQQEVERQRRLELDERLAAERRQAEVEEAERERTRPERIAAARAALERVRGLPRAAAGGGR